MPNLKTKFATNYQKIAEENIQRYGTAIDEYGPMLLSDRYSDRTHFIYELLQNAEDAIGWRQQAGDDFSKDVEIELHPDKLVFRHFGQQFAENYVRATVSYTHLTLPTKA